MRKFFNLSGTAYVMCLSLFGLFGFLLFAGLLVITLVHPFERPLPYAIGLFTGTLMSLVKVVLLERSIARAVDIGEAGKAKTHGSLQAILRYFGTIAVLALAVIFPSVFGVFGMIFGVLSLQLSAYITNVVLKKRPDLIDDAPEDDA